MTAYVIIAVVVAWFAGAVGTVYAGWRAVDRLCWRQRLADVEEVDLDWRKIGERLERGEGLQCSHLEKIDWGDVDPNEAFKSCMTFEEMAEKTGLFKSPEYWRIMEKWPGSLPMPHEKKDA